MARIRGTAIAPRIKFLKMRGFWDEVVPGLSESTRAVVDGTVLATSWHDFDVFRDLVETADRVCGSGDLELAREMGRHAATANLSTVFRVLIRFATPQGVLAKGASLWRHHHDSGKAVAYEEGETAIYEIHDFAVPDRVLCVSLEGWIERCLEMTGAKGVRIRESDCATRTGNICRFHGTWRRQ